MSSNDMLSPDAARLIREAEEGQARLLTAAPAPVSAHRIPSLSAYVGSDVGSCGNESCSHPWCMHRRWAYQSYWEELNASEPCADLSCGNSNCFQLRSNEMSFYDDVYEPGNDDCRIHGSNRHECRYHASSSCSKPCENYACNHELCFELRELEAEYEDERKKNNIDHARWLYYRRQRRIQKLRAKRLLKREGLALIRLSALFAISDDF